MAPKIDPTLSETGNTSGTNPPPPPPPPRSPPPSGQVTPTGSTESKHEQRLKTLLTLLRDERGAIEVTNASFERGRPSLVPAENMRGDVTNLYNRPSTDFLYNLKPVKISNNMATSEEMMRIQAALEGLGVNTEAVSGLIIQLAIYCAHTSSSSFQDPKGTFEWEGGGAIMRDDVVGKIQEIAGLRRVCRLYAPVVWNYMHLQQSPPADWRAMGFNYNCRYAAFDTFDYVENEAAIKPLGGINPRPTNAEYIAYNTYKTLALNKANNNETYANTDAEITGGRFGPKIVQDFNNANNKRQ